MRLNRPYEYYKLMSDLEELQADLSYIDFKAIEFSSLGLFDDLVKQVEKIKTGLASAPAKAIQNTTRNLSSMLNKAKESIRKAKEVAKTDIKKASEMVSGASGVLYSIANQTKSVGKFLLDTGAKARNETIQKFGSLITSVGEKARKTATNLIKRGISVGKKVIGGPYVLGSKAYEIASKTASTVSDTAKTLLGVLSEKDRKKYGYKKPKEQAKEIIEEAGKIDKEKLSDDISYLMDTYGLSYEQASNLVNQAQEYSKKLGIPYEDSLVQVLEGAGIKTTEAITKEPEKPAIPWYWLAAGVAVIGGVYLITREKPKEEKIETEVYG